jgi:hypothetical protein
LREGRARLNLARLRSIRAVRVSGQAALDSIWVTLLGVDLREPRPRRRDQPKTSPQYGFKRDPKTSVNRL